MAATARKVKASTSGATVATALSTLAIWALNKYVFPADMDPLAQAEIIAAVPTALAAAAAWASGYFAKQAHQDLGLATQPAPAAPPPAPPPPPVP